MSLPFEYPAAHRSLWQVLHSRRRLLGLSLLSCILIAGLYLAVSKPIYRSEAIVHVTLEKEGFSLNNNQRLPEPAQTPALTEIEILQARRILRPVVRELGLDVVLEDPHPGVHLRLEGYESAQYPETSEPAFRLQMRTAENYILFSATGETLGEGRLGQPFRAQALGFTLDATGLRGGQEIWFKKLAVESAIMALRKRMTVEEIGQQTSLIHVAVDMPDPNLAYRSVNAIMRSYIDQNLENRSREASQTLAFLEHQIELTQGHLEKGEIELDNLKSQRGVFELSEEAKRLIDQISKLEITKADIQLRHGQLAQLAARLESGRHQDEPYLLGEVSLPDETTGKLVGELSQRLVELRGVRQMYTDLTPRVIQLRAQIEELKTKIRSTVRNGERTLAAQLGAADKMVKTYENRLRELPQVERELAALSRKSSVNAEMYTFLLKKVEEARMARAGIVGNLRVIDEGVLPHKPLRPIKWKVLAMATLLGILFGISAAFIVEYADDSVKNSDEIESRLGLVISGAIPLLAADLNEGAPRVDEMSPRSPFVEAFRALGTNLQFVAGKQGTKVIACVSGSAGEGKTTISANLAITQALTGSRVLLIDADMRRPSLHHFLKMPGSHGLIDALRDGVDWQALVLPTRMGNLSLLPAGQPPENPAAYLGANTWSQLLEAVREHFDYILVDVPPLHLFAESNVVASRADGVFLILTQNVSRHREARASLASLTKMQAPILGAIFTKVRRDDNEDPYLRYYQTQPGSRSKLDRVRDYLLNS